MSFARSKVFSSKITQDIISKINYKIFNLLWDTYMTWKLNYYKWKLTKKKWIFLETWILILLYQLNFTIDFTITENYWKNYQGECLGCCTMLDSKLLLLSKVESSLKQSPDSPCKTKCGDSGCQCVSNKILESMDHLLLVSETGHIVTCLCGNYQVNSKLCKIYLSLDPILL